MFTVRHPSRGGNCPVAEVPGVSPAPADPSSLVTNHRIPTINTTPAMIAAMIGVVLRRRECARWVRLIHRWTPLRLAELTVQGMPAARSLGQLTLAIRQANPGMRTHRESGMRGWSPATKSSGAIDTEIASSPVARDGRAGAMETQLPDTISHGKANWPETGNALCTGNTPRTCLGLHPELASRAGFRLTTSSLGISSATEQKAVNVRQKERWARNIPVCGSVPAVGLSADPVPDRMTCARPQGKNDCTIAGHTLAGLPARPRPPARLEPCTIDAARFAFEPACRCLRKKLMTRSHCLSPLDMTVVAARCCRDRLRVCCPQGPTGSSYWCRHLYWRRERPTRT